MNQIALPLFLQASLDTEASASPVPRPTPESAAATGFDAVGFEIGWDYARHRLTPPADHLHGQHPVRQGWEAGRATFGARTLKPNRHVRHWLQLRLRAWAQQQPYENLMLTPRYLAQIEPLQCPVTREVLTHETGAPSDAVVVRLNPQAGYAPGHLATVSRRVAQVMSSHESHADGGNASAAELDAAQQGRLACLMSMTTPAPHERIAATPLRVLPPNRLRLLNPVQALQALLTQLFLGEAYARRMAAVASLMPSADARRSYHLFMNAMLARRLAAGWSADRNRLRVTLEDAWGHPVIARRWEQLALRLRQADCERIVKLAVQRRLLGSGVRWLDDDAATEGWALEPSTPKGPQHPILPPAGLAKRMEGEAGVPAARNAAAGDALAWRRWQRAHVGQEADAGLACTV